MNLLESFSFKLCVCVSGLGCVHLSAGALGKAEEDIRSPGARGGCESSDKGAGTYI